MRLPRPGTRPASGGPSDLPAHLPAPTVEPLGPGDIRARAEWAVPLGVRTASEWAGKWTPYLGVWRDGGVIDPPSVPVPTGDYGVVDSEGWLTVLDRLKVLIVRGGANVYPAEVERVLLAQEGVRGAAVFGVPDERMGERVAALVELNEDVAIESLAAACRAELADYKVPERWGIVDALPRNAMGKVVRTGLVDLLEGSA